MRTLHVGLRVTDLGRSLAFYTAIGYQVVGSVPETPIGHLTMLKLPGDEFVTVELVHDGDPVDRGTDVSHFVVQVESMADTLGVRGVLRAGAVHGRGTRGLPRQARVVLRRLTLQPRSNHLM
jgi:catechol 2,3-dioxygenase-like lactoylglutathione lyase family enzyme